MRFHDLTERGEFMRYAQENNPEIKEIDSAIPHQVLSELIMQGANTSMLCTVYFRDGRTQIENSVEIAQVAYKNTEYKYVKLFNEYRNVYLTIEGMADRYYMEEEELAEYIAKGKRILEGEL